MDLLVVSVAFVNPGVPLSRRVYLHLTLDTMLPAPILTNLKIITNLTIENIVLAWSGEGQVRVRRDRFGPELYPIFGFHP